MMKDPVMHKVKLDPTMKEQALTIVSIHWGHCMLCKAFDNAWLLNEVWCKDKGMLSQIFGE